MLTLNTFNFIQRTVNTENVHSDFWFLNTFSFQLVPFFLGSSLSHCLLSVHFCISLCWSARNKMIPFNRGLRVVVFLCFRWKQDMVFYIGIFKWKIFISKCTARQLSQAHCIVFPIYSIRLLIFIKVNFSSNFMLETPSNLTFNFKNRGPVSPANISELEWIWSKLLRAKTGKKKALSASRACCMATMACRSYRQ